MKNNKTFYLAVALSVSLLVTLIRLGMQGWLALVGIVSAAFFGPLHSLFLYQWYRRFERLDTFGKRSAWVALVTYPMLFLFQFDFGDDAGSYFTFEFFIGEGNWMIEQLAAYVAPIAAFVYLVNFGLWQVKTRKQAVEKPKS